MYHGKMQPGKLGLTPSNASCNFHGYESPIPKIVAACLQKSQDAQARCDIMYDVKLDKQSRINSHSQTISAEQVLFRDEMKSAFIIFNPL